MRCHGNSRGGSFTSFSVTLKNTNICVKFKKKSFKHFEQLCLFVVLFTDSVFGDVYFPSVCDLVFTVLAFGLIDQSLIRSMMQCCVF